MNNVIIPISDLLYTVDRPVIMDIVRQLMDIVQISSRTNILFLGEENTPAQKGTQIDDQSTTTNIWPYNDKVSIEVSMNSDPDRVLSTVVKDPEQLFVFYDDPLGIYIKPVYITNKVEVTFKFRASDRNKIESWRNDIRTKTSMYREINLHDATYSYTLPKALFTILKEVHKLRELKAPYNEDFLTYFSDRLTNRGSTVSTLNGEKAEWVIAEKQARIQGRFDFQDLPDKPEKVGDSSAFETTFTYSFSFERPTEVNLVYPSVIHNQILDTKFRIVPKLETYKDKRNSYSFSSKVLNKFQTDTQVLQAMGNKGIHIPDFDADFIPNSIPSGTSRILTALCLITEDDKRTLFNLKDLGDYNLSESIIKFIEFDRENIPKTYKSILTLDLYEEGNLRPSNSLIIDSDLNVSATEDLDIRKTYRVRLGLVVNLHFLSNSVLRRIKEYGRDNPTFMLKIASSINSILKDIGTRSDVGGSHLQKDDLIKLGIIYNNLGDGSFEFEADPVYYNSEEVKFMLVENFFIVPRSMNEYDNKNQPIQNRYRYKISTDYTLIDNLPLPIQLSLEYWLNQYLIEP